MIGNIAAQNEWEINRLGKLTASKIRNILVEPKTKEARANGELSETLKTYLIEKVTEIATGTTRQISTYSTQWGEEYEPVAAMRIKERYPDFVYLGKDNPQFFEYSDFSGGSPDGYSPSAKIVGEVKCPENPANHTAYLLLKDQYDMQRAEPDYYCQLQFNMMCMAKHLGCEFSEMKGLFVSYCPIYEGVFEALQYKEMVILPDMDIYEKINTALPKAEKALAEAYSEMLELTKSVTLITGEQVNGTNLLIVEKG